MEASSPFQPMLQRTAVPPKVAATANTNSPGRRVVPAVPNTGAGPRRYDDRGAYEFHPVGPTAHLTVIPGVGRTPLTVTANASTSAPGNAPISRYTFSFGDRTTAGSRAAGKAVHTYTSAGAYTVKVRVTDSDGLTSTATRRVTVRWGSRATSRG